MAARMTPIVSGHLMNSILFYKISWGRMQRDEVKIAHSKVFINFLSQFSIIANKIENYGESQAKIFSTCFRHSCLTRKHFGRVIQEQAPLFNVVKELLNFFINWINWNWTLAYRNWRQRYCSYDIFF